MLFESNACIADYAIVTVRRMMNGWMLACRVWVAGMALVLHLSAQAQVIDDRGADSTSRAVEAVALSENAEAISAQDAPLSTRRNRTPTPTVEDQLEGKLTLADVVASVYRYFPVIQQAQLERSVAGGQYTSAMGAYDTQLYVQSLSEPTGFYRNYRQGLGAYRQTWWGGYVSAGYRIGRGEFQPWYQERVTNQGGELSVGVGWPLLQGRAIDPQRVAVFQAGLAQQAVGPQVQLSLLQASFQAAQVYWEWVAAGARLVAQDELVLLAQVRQDQFEEGAKAGKFAQIDVVFNRQLLAERSSKRLEAEQKFREAGIKLSLYLRDPSGVSLVPEDGWLPLHFPVIQPVPATDFQADFQSALARRPELALLSIEAQQIRLDRQLAQNQRLPNLDIVTEASQDVGRPATTKNDKGQFELMLGIRGDVPIQRRNAIGKVQQTTAKLSQIEQKVALQRDKIAIEMRTALNALELSNQRVEQISNALQAAFESLTSYRQAFQLGYADLLYLNILETKANEVEILVVDAQRDWFVFLANLQAALGLDPLEQALNVSQLPESTRPGPGDLPKEAAVAPREFESDWQKRTNRGPS
ncbi:MAG: TolC family protein [Pirellulaceae bacterium]|nr:TolC family protein [Pirellulaceae bacterium]